MIMVEKFFIHQNLKDVESLNRNGGCNQSTWHSQKGPSMLRTYRRSA